jgi:hypothetical protein
MLLSIFGDHRKMIKESASSHREDSLEAAYHPAMQDSICSKCYVRFRAVG